MSRLLRLYPPAWRERYGAEIKLIFAQRGITWADRFDLLRGVLPAWQLHRSRHGRQSSQAGMCTSSTLRRGLLRWPLVLALLSGGTGATSAMLVHRVAFAALPPHCEWVQRGHGWVQVAGQGVSCELLPGWNVLSNPFHGLAVLPFADHGSVPRVLAPGQQIELFSDRSEPVYPDALVLPSDTKVVFPSTSGRSVTIRVGQRIAVIVVGSGRERSRFQVAGSRLLRRQTTEVLPLYLRPSAASSVYSCLWTATEPGTSSISIHLPSGHAASLAVRVTA